MGGARNGIFKYAAALVFILQLSAAHGQAPLPPLKTSGAVIFGSIQYGQDATMQLTLTNENENEVTLRQVAISGSSPTPFLVQGPILPVSLGYRRQAVYDVTFSPQQEGNYPATLEVTYDERGASKTVYVSVSGNGACTSITASCDPKVPLCRVPEETPHELWTVKDFTKSISPFISDHYAIHSFRPDKPYDMPVSTFWNILGLGNVFSDPSAGIDCNCGYTIHFERDISMIRRAVFTRSGPDIDLKSPAIPGDSSIELKIPGYMSGVTYVFPGTSEFHFTSGAPHLTVRWQGQDIFDDDLSCSNSSTAYASIRRVHPTADRPGLDMLFKGTDK